MLGGHFVDGWGLGRLQEVHGEQQFVVEHLVLHLLGLVHLDLRLLHDVDRRKILV